MNKLALIPMMVGLAVAYAAAQAPATQTAPAAAAPGARATLKDAQGKTLGEATLRESPAGVLVKLDLQGVPPGPHAFHIHTVGKCDPPDFMTAGGHFNPTTMKHGLMAAGGPHAGDMPNLFVPADGKLSVEVLDANVTLAAGQKSLFDADGSALMLHAMADDYATDPAGAAGGRIACGVVTK
jgi:Cu-Zn family superoxide dismutase